MRRPRSTHGRARRSRRQRPHRTPANRPASAVGTVFGEIVIPPAVLREIARGGPRLPNWIRLRTLVGEPNARVAEALLGAGETEAIGLALEAKATRVILDDLQARRLAKRVGLTVVGTAGILFAAKRQGLITAVRPPLDALREAGFRLRQNVYKEILRSAGETKE